MVIKITNLHLVALATVLAMAVGAHGGGVPVLSFCCGIALALVLPGYALVSALFVPGTLSAAERLSLTLGLSLAVAILGGLALNVMPVGLRPLSWAVLLGNVSLVADLAALLRRNGTPLALPSFVAARMTPREAAMAAAALALITGACVLSSIGEVRQFATGTTELWMLPGSATSGQQTVTLGVANQGGTAMSYRLTVTLAGTTLQVIAPVELRSGARWQTTLAVPPHGGSAPALLEVQLTSMGGPTLVTRHVSLWLAPSAVTATGGPHPLIPPCVIALQYASHALTGGLPAALQAACDAYYNGSHQDGITPSPQGRGEKDGLPR